MSNVVMDFKFFESEIRRSYKVLGYLALMQNSLDISSWLGQGLINHEESDRLIEINKNIHITYYSSY